MNYWLKMHKEVLEEERLEALKAGRDRPDAIAEEPVRECEPARRRSARAGLWARLYRR